VSLKSAWSELWSTRKPAVASKRAYTSDTPIRHSGRRVSVDTENDLFITGLTFLQPISQDQYWRNLQLDSKTLDKIDPQKLMEILADLSPDVSRALWDFLRMCNPGYEAKALKPGTDKQDPAAQAALDAFIAVLNDKYGSFDVVVGRLFIGAFLRGSFLAELVLDDSARMPIDIATPDPATLRFRRDKDENGNLVWRMGQWQWGQYVELDLPTIRYIPVDPYPGSPYGRAIAAPAMFTSLFLMGLLHDLRRVVSQQGYPRQDLVVKLQAIRDAMPADIQNDSDKFKKWVEDTIEDIQDVYNNLEPDDAYVHTDVVDVKSPVGALNASSLGAIDGMIKGLERMSMRALKSMPLLMGTTDGVSEANANRQWEIHVAGIKALQHLAETMLERLFGYALQVQGIAARVKFNFSELRAAELLRDAQVETLNIANAARKRDEGWQTNDEAANSIVGHNAVAAPATSIPALSGGGGLMGVQADPGSNRAVNAQGFTARLRNLLRHDLPKAA